MMWSNANLSSRRLATLLALFVGLKGDPGFEAAYRRRISALSDKS
jgi:hypothetical protein